MNIKNWIDKQIDSEKKKAIPVLTFPCIKLMGITVNELISSSENQAKGMYEIAKRCDSGAALSMMDLSVEAEAFGSEIRFSDDEVPTVIGHIIDTLEDAEKLNVPEIGAKRTGIYIEAIKKAKELIKDRPVFAGVIGPFSLAARLVGVSEAMLNLYMKPDMMKVVLSKSTEFCIKYALAYKEIGADGIVMAEPASGLLSPNLMEDFSNIYVKQIIDAVQDENFAVIYHNCGGSVLKATESLSKLGAFGYHFGNSINLKDIISLMPKDSLVMGNIDPASAFCNGSIEKIHEDTLNLLNECGSFKNFIPSSGCDIPPITPWENIDEFFNVVSEFYK